jgi:tRNA pseudouridine55 synthase
LDVSTLQAPSQKEIEEKLSSIIWYHALPLTPFSAKKRKGKKLYEYARAGEPIFIDIDMQVLSFRIVSYNFPELVIEIQVGSGTYIRSIAHWLWEQFSLGGILTALHRSKVGEYSLDNT